MPPRDPYTRVRAFCLALPEVKELPNHGFPSFQVAKKTFVMCMNNHHRDGKVALWVKSTHDDQADMVEHDPERFFVPPYVGPRGWVGIRLDVSPQWKMIESILRDAYRLMAPKRLLP